MIIQIDVEGFCMRHEEARKMKKKKDKTKKLDNERF